MPHYKDGTKGEVGDLVAGPTGDGVSAIGTVIGITEGDTCNCRIEAHLGFVGPARFPLSGIRYLNMRDALKVILPLLLVLLFAGCSSVPAATAQEIAVASASAQAERRGGEMTGPRR